MPVVEPHDTVDEVKIIEKLDFQLDITDRAYRSEYDAEGEVRMLANATHEVVENRQAPPQGAFDLLWAALGGDGGLDRFPNTRVFVGLSRSPPTEQDDDSFHEDITQIAADVEGVPTDATVAFDTDWTVAEAETARSEGKKSVHSEAYDIKGFSSDRLPIVVRANLYRDAVELTDGTNDDIVARQRLEGLSALEIEIEHRSEDANAVLELPRFEVRLSSTFPQVEFSPRNNSTYDPESRTVRWTGQRIEGGDTGQFLVLGPITELLDIETVEATLRGELRNRTLSGLRLDGVYDELGDRFPSTANLETERKVTITSDIEIDPSALSGQAQEVTRAKIRTKTTPKSLYEALVELARREGIRIKSQQVPKGGDVVLGQEGVFEVTEDEDQDSDSRPGRLQIKKEFGNRGVVHAEVTVTGRFTAVSEETRVSAFDESEDQLVRADEGAMDRRGEATAKVVARSTDSELNSELIGTLESVFGGDN